MPSLLSISPLPLVSYHVLPEMYTESVRAMSWDVAPETDAVLQYALLGPEAYTK
jgi:hypothetical protein